jgi:hypothetical protein
MSVFGAVAEKNSEGSCWWGADGRHPRFDGGERKSVTMMSFFSE